MQFRRKSWPGCARKPCVPGEGSPLSPQPPKAIRHLLPSSMKLRPTITAEVRSRGGCSADAVTPHSYAP